MSVVLCNGDDVKIVQNGFIMRDHCIQLMLRPHSLLLQSHRDQRCLTLSCCLCPFLQLHQPGFKYCCGLDILFARLMPCMLHESLIWLDLAGSLHQNMGQSHTVTHHQFGARAAEPLLLNHGDGDTTQFFASFSSFLPLIPQVRITSICWTSMAPLPPLMWLTGGAGDWWAEDIQNNIT